MHQLPKHGREPDHIIAALEASCGALLVLEVTRQEIADAGSALEEATREVERAMASVRRAIAVLHAAAEPSSPAEDAELASFAFVLGAHDA